MEIVDAANCDQEPIRIPGSIQPHGVLLVLDEDGTGILQASANVEEMLGRPVQQVLGASLSELLGLQQAGLLEGGFERALAATRPVLLGTITVEETKKSFHAVAHRADGSLILELELAEPGVSLPDVHPLIDAFTLQVEAVTELDELALQTAEEIRNLTGFDRVLIYRFDEGWNGTVIGEAGNGRLPRLLEHRFPASDIPAQARELYRLNRLRIIPDAHYTPVPLVPALHPGTGKPLDMSFSTLRSVSPVHVEYMRNMETSSSMSVSILRNGNLWGLVSCHHKQPKGVPFQVRTTCDLLARAFALRLAGLESSQDYERRIEVRSSYSKLLAVMADQLDFAAALTAHTREFLAFAAAQGAAVLTEEKCLLVGVTPSEEQVRELAAWLFSEVQDEVYSTDSLVQVYPPARPFTDKAAGLLAVAISKAHPSYILWFRPEVLQTVQWGGDPSKPGVARDGASRLSPRKSFETWRETVRDRSLPWQPSELQGAAELRNSVVGIVLRRAEELAGLNAELTRSNKELEAFSYSVSHDLRAPLRHIAGYAELMKDGGAGDLSPTAQRYVGIIIESSEYAGKLVDRLLDFSRMGRSQLQKSSIDMNALLLEVRREVMNSHPQRQVEWRVAKLPLVQADLVMLRLAVRNLLDNALKYSRGRDPAIVEIGSRVEGNETVFWVKDNGVGFDMKYSNKLFGVFQRLHRMEDYEGTGIGLANVRRVLERHGGRTWAEGEDGKGATFYFSIPIVA